MPWYWSDEIARHLVATQKLEPDQAQILIARPVAIRRAETSLEDAAVGLQDDDEIPLAA